MIRNLDLRALRSFVAVADAGGVTRAAGFLNLTQSAVSMQIKRLEDMLQVELLDRSGRKVALTAAGEQLIGYARRMLALNHEAFGRLTHNSFEGEIVLGVPHDIVYPNIPQVLQRFNHDYPKMKVTLLSSVTRSLIDQFGRGECDIILATEDGRGIGGETLVELPLVWIGAPGGRHGGSGLCGWRMNTAVFFANGRRPRWIRRRSHGKWRWKATIPARSRPLSAPIWRCIPCWPDQSRSIWNASRMGGPCRNWHA